VHALILAELGNDWSLAASIETFAIPVGLFVVIAAILFYILTRPHVVPGHRELVPAGAGTARASAAPARNGGAEAPPTTEDGS
jgi:hypothetical protein